MIGLFDAFARPLLLSLDAEAAHRATIVGLKLAPLPASRADDARLLTQRYTRALEELIRQDPTQYLWLHRRWKHQPQPRRALATISRTSARPARS